MSRRRVLVVEDEVLVGMLLEEMLDELEAEIAEPPTPRPMRRGKKLKRSF